MAATLMYFCPLVSSLRVWSKREPRVRARQSLPGRIGREEAANKRKSCLLHCLADTADGERPTCSRGNNEPHRRSSGRLASASLIWAADLPAESERRPYRAAPWEKVNLQGSRQSAAGRHLLLLLVPHAPPPVAGRSARARRVPEQRTAAVFLDHLARVGY